MFIDNVKVDIQVYMNHISVNMWKEERCTDPSLNLLIDVKWLKRVPNLLLSSKFEKIYDDRDDIKLSGY